MNRVNKTAVVALILLVVVAIILFTYTLVSAPTAVEHDDTRALGQPAAQSGQTITAKHQYRGGLHTIAGTVELPTPCHKVVVAPFIDAQTNSVELRMNTTYDDSTMCAQVVTQTPFKVTFEAPEQVSITATIDGASVEINLVPIEPNETLDAGGQVKG